MKNIFLLDMDETLLDFQRAEETNFFQTLAQFGIDADKSVYHRFHKINDDLWKLLEKGGIEREVLKVRRFALLCEEYGYAVDVEAMASAYFKNFEEVCFPYDGVLNFLTALATRGRIYIVTNGGTDIQKRHIKDAGFEPFLSGVFISEEVGENKPSKAYADYVAAHISDYEKSRAIWIGDSLTSDMVCANNAGVDFILYAPAGMPKGYGGRYARNYNEVLSLIEKL